MSTYMTLVSIGHGPMRSVTEAVSVAWLAVIGLPETVHHAATLIRACRRQVVAVRDQWKDSHK
jgi:hypothetical protein